MISAPGLHCGFGDLLGAETLDEVRGEKFTIPRITANKPEPNNQHWATGMASPERCRDLAQEVVDAGLQPLLSVVKADQVSLVHLGTLIEAGNEPDVKTFGWTRQGFVDMSLSVMKACEARGLKCYLGAISNPHKRGLEWLALLPWKDIPVHVGCSFHWYPNGAHTPPTEGHDGKTREQEVAAIRAIVGKERPLAVTEVGYSNAHYTKQEAADNMAWERRFWSGQGVEVVVLYQLNDGPKGDTSGGQYGARDSDLAWKPVAKAFVDAVAVVDPAPPVVTPPTPSTGTVITLKSDHGFYLCTELDGQVVANRSVAGPWEQFQVEAISGDKYALKGAHGLYLTAELDQTVRARSSVIAAWEEWTLVVDGDRVAFQSAHGKFLTAELNGSVRARADAINSWERWTSDPSGWWNTGPAKTRRPLAGPLRVENKLFRDDSGYRRVFGDSDFTLLRKLRFDPAAYDQSLEDAVRAGYQTRRVFASVGGWMGYWDGKEVAAVSFDKWFFDRNAGHLRPAGIGTHIAAWPDYDDLFRQLLRDHRARGLRLHLTFADCQIILPNGDQELALHDRLARIAAEEGGSDVVAYWEVTNEYPINRSGGDGSASVEQMGRVIDTVRRHLPDVLCAQGACLSEEPSDLAMSARYGHLCAVHTTRDPFDVCLKRTLGLVFWEGNYRAFPKPYWQGEPKGPNVGPMDGQGDDMYLPTNDPSEIVALYAAHAITGQASNFFDGAAVRGTARSADAWGYDELPALFEQVLPEDVALWHHSNNGRGGIMYWSKDKAFVAVTWKGWDPSPPQPIAEWTFYHGDSEQPGSGTPPAGTGLLVGRFA